jgi:hypothetical protein
MSVIPCTIAPQASLGLAETVLGDRIQWEPKGSSCIEHADEGLGVAVARQFIEADGS